MMETGPDQSYERTYPPGMRNLKLILEYDGTGLAGWQRQVDRPSVQGHVENALQRLTGEKASVVAAGRTDAGVHALGMAAHFKTNSHIADSEMMRGLNALLPSQIAAKAVEEMPLSFHARFDARSKIYDYNIFVSPVRSTINRHFAWHIRQNLNREAMTEALEFIRGEHDFASFQSVGSIVKSTTRRMIDVEFADQASGEIQISIEGDGFLRHMVRAIVGTIVEVGRGRFTTMDFKEILEARDRSKAGATAPARGLFLREVRY